MTDNEIFESNLLSFEIMKRYGTKAQCRCPAHDDKHASLTITKGRKCTLFYCHAGCSVDEILGAAGLKKKDTFYDVEPRSPNWKAYIEGREKRRIEAVYNYFSINGGYAFTKVRCEEKKIIYGKLQNDRFTYGLGHDVGRKSYKAIYGSIQAINKAIAEGRPIFIPEGEKDVDTLTKQGYTAFTYGGVNDWQSDFDSLESVYKEIGAERHAGKVIRYCKGKPKPEKKEESIAVKMAKKLGQKNIGEKQYNDIINSYRR